jgi:hypothetical protein
MTKDTEAIIHEPYCHSSGRHKNSLGADLPSCINYEPNMVTDCELVKLSMHFICLADFPSIPEESEIAGSKLCVRFLWI